MAEIISDRIADNSEVPIEKEKKDIPSNYASLSIDIGYKNLAFSIYMPNENNLVFGLLNIEEEIKKYKEKASNISKRVRVLHDFIENHCLCFNIKKVIIERQTPKNTVAMSIMYSIASICWCLGIQNIVIFDPKRKFKYYNVEYDTKNKKHKKLSIELCEKVLQEKMPEFVETFKGYEKKDDLADSILMNFVCENDE